MTAEQFLATFEKTRGVTVYVNKRRLRCKKITMEDRATLRHHSAALIAWIGEGKELPLAPVIEKADYLTSGFCKMDNGAWTHPAGDQQYEALLYGLEHLDSALLTERARKNRIMCKDALTPRPQDYLFLNSMLPESKKRVIARLPNMTAAQRARFGILAAAYRELRDEVMPARRVEPVGLASSLNPQFMTGYARGTK